MFLTRAHIFANHVSCHFFLAGGGQLWLIASFFPMPLILDVCYGNIPPQGTTSYTTFLLLHSKPPQSFVI